MAQIIITVDLGYGDGGKGSVIDTLARNKPTDLVVRYSGGPQAAHNVLTPDGRHHTFAQFGSGTFVEGVKTYIGSDMIVNPYTMLIEAEALGQAGIHDALPRMYIDAQAPLITEFNVLTNQMRETLRTHKHGTCGAGVYETRKDTRHYQADQLLLAEDFLNLKRAKEKLHFLRDKKYINLKEEFPTLFAEDSHLMNERAHNLFLDDRFIEETLFVYARLAFSVSICDTSIVTDSLKTGKQVLFEGSQGVLLDENHGFLPYVTGSEVTTKPAFDIINEIGSPKDIYTLGITRAYMSRHGHGPLVTEDAKIKEYFSEEHNSSTDSWQGDFRYGWFDPLATRYAIEATGGVDGLAVTCLDQISLLPTFTYAQKYTDVEKNELNAIPTQEGMTEQQRVALTDTILTCTPVLETCSNKSEEIIKTISTTCGVDVAMTSKGKTASEKEIFF